VKATLFTLCKRGDRKSGFVVMFQSGVGAYVRIGEHGRVFVPMKELKKVGVSKLEAGRELWFQVRREQGARHHNLVAYDVAVPPRRRKIKKQRLAADEQKSRPVLKVKSPKPRRWCARLLSMDEKGNGKVLLITDSKGFGITTAYVNIQAFREARFSVEEEVVPGLKIEVTLHEADLPWVVNRVFRIR
jgi:cold shock CspA family protein